MKRVANVDVAAQSMSFIPHTVYHSNRMYSMLDAQRVWSSSSEWDAHVKFWDRRVSQQPPSKMTHQISHNQKVMDGPYPGWQGAWWDKLVCGTVPCWPPPLLSWCVHVLSMRNFTLSSSEAPTPPKLLGAVMGPVAPSEVDLELLDPDDIHLHKTSALWPSTQATGLRQNIQ